MNRIGSHSSDAEYRYDIDMRQLFVFTSIKQILGFNNDDATMDAIFRIFENYESRKRPFIGERLNVTGWVLNQTWKKTIRHTLNPLIRNQLFPIA